MPTEAYVRYIKKNCTGLVQVKIEDAATEEPVEDAVVQCTIVNEAGGELGGQAWPLLMPHVSGGDYHGYLSEQLEGEVGSNYEAHIVCTSPTAGVSNVVVPVEFELNRGDYDGG